MSALGKVTVIMPNYNYGKYISESISSVLAQTHRDLQLIVIDDCSKDDSVKVITEWQKKDSRLVLMVNEVNRGAAESQNVAMQKMTGDFLALCDADDVWYPQKLEVQLAHFRRNPSLGLVHAQADIINSEGNPTGQKFTEVFSASEPRRSGRVFEQMVIRNHPCSSSTIIRREAADYAGLFDSDMRYLYDWTYWVRVARKYDFAYEPEPLLSYRVHGSSTAHDSSGYDVARIRASELIQQRFPDLQRKTLSRVLIIRGLSQRSLGLRKEANKTFRASLEADPLNWKAWIRWIQTF